MSSHLEDELTVLRAAIEASPVVILFIDRNSMRIVDANETACRSLGYTREELRTQELRHVVTMPSVEAMAARFDAPVDGKNGSTVMWACHRARNGNTTPVQWLLRVVPADEGPVLVVVARGAAKRPQHTLEAGAATPRPAATVEVPDGVVLSNLSEPYVGGYDALTALPDRRRFEHRLASALEAANQRADRSFALLFIDLDGFKAVNDAHGHLAGDRVLREIAARLATSVRAGDMVARYGGDEFVVLLDHVRNQDDALRVAERIRARFGAPIKVEGRHVAVGASIGMALSWNGYKTAEQMLHDADRAMYRAKSVGRAGSVVSGLTER